MYNKQNVQKSQLNILSLINRYQKCMIIKIIHGLKLAQQITIYHIVHSYIIKNQVLYFYYGPNDYVQIICNNTTSIATQSVNTLSYKSLDMYPIGSVYTSTINIDPKELFGGEWKTIDNNNNTVIYMWECISQKLYFF